MAFQTLHARRGVAGLACRGVTPSRCGCADGEHRSWCVRMATERKWLLRNGRPLTGDVLPSAARELKRRRTALRAEPSAPNGEAMALLLAQRPLQRHAAACRRSYHLCQCVYAQRTPCRGAQTSKGAAPWARSFLTLSVFISCTLLGLFQIDVSQSILNPSTSSKDLSEPELLF